MAGFSVMAALMIGFLAGLLTFKAKQQWCAACGQTSTCPMCLTDREANRGS